MKKKTNYFYESFVNLMDYAIKCMSILKEGLLNFDYEKALELKNNVHKFEHEADEQKHLLEEKLAKEFITPIDREDIFLLWDKIDDLIDSIDEVSYKLYLRNYTHLPENISLFIEEAEKAINCTKDIFVNFNSIDKKQIMDPLIHKVLEIEENVDKLFENNVRQLYLEECSYDKLRKLERVYNNFEYITDKCRDIVKLVSLIMYKNL